MTDRSSLSAATDACDLSTAEQNIRYFQKGSGRSVLCLHATGHGSGDFEPLATRLGDHFEFTAVDWPGHGASEADGHPPDADRYADLVIELIETLKLNQPVLLGNSIGGAAAIMAAYRRPDLISGLVLCNPGGLAAVDSAARFVTKRMAGLFAAGARGASWFDPIFAFYYRKMVLPGAPDRADQIISVGSANALLLQGAWTGFGQQAADLRALPRQIDLPVWLAWAKQDRFVSWGRSKAAARTFPNHSVTFYRGGHAPFLEQPDAFATDFLEALSRF